MPHAMASPSSKRNPSSSSQDPSKPSPHNVPPSAWLLALELRAFWEFGALLPKPGRCWPARRAVTGMP
jgi:hypothetical protein